MRGLRAVLVLIAILIGQAHACVASFVTEAGLPCEKCISVPCQFSSLKECQGSSVGITKSERDCHSCCTIKVCEDRQSQLNKSLGMSLTLEYDFPAIVLLTLYCPIQERPRIEVLAADQFANPPPSERPSRAPPFRLS